MEVPIVLRVGRANFVASIILFSVLIVLSVGLVRAQDPSTPNAEPVYIRLNFADLQGQPAGEIEIELTAEPSGSCLGDIHDQGHAVRVLRQAGLQSRFQPTNSLAAIFKEGHLKLDLSGGICDSYRIVEGQFEGKAGYGRIYWFGRGGESNFGSFSARLLGPGSGHE